jgi:hypothetical protein
MARSKKGEAKRGRPKKGQKTHRLKGRKRRIELVRIELVSLVVGNYFTHGPFNVTNMQIMRSNSRGRLKTNITYQRNLPLYSRS